MASLQPQRLSTLEQLYPTISRELLETITTLDDWESIKTWSRENGESCMNTLGKGFAMYIAGTETLLAVLGPTAVDEVKPMLEEAERETAVKDWDEEKQCWI